jgi:hypothetical protein
MTSRSLSLPSALSVGVAILGAIVVFTVLEVSSQAPGQKTRVARLEAAVSAQGLVRPAPAPPGDRAAARALCSQSLAHAIGDLERALPSRARKLGVQQAHIQVGAPTSGPGGSVAAGVLIFQGSPSAIGASLAQADKLAPSFFVDAVTVTPLKAEQGLRAETRGRVVCARP